MVTLHYYRSGAIHQPCVQAIIDIGLLVVHGHAAIGIAMVAPEPALFCGATIILAESGEVRLAGNGAYLPLSAITEPMPHASLTA